MKYFLPIIFFVFANLCFYSLSAEESLTVKQQLDRIKQEVSDLNKAVFNKSFDSDDLNLKNNQDDAERFTSIDIRMYDLEKDIKNLTLQFEEIIFKLDDFSNYIQKLENDMNLNLNEIKNKIEIQNIESSGKEKSTTLDGEEENTLGKLVISENTNEISNNEEITLEEKMINQDKELNNLTPEGIAEYEKKHPLGFGQLEDISNLATFLLSDASRWISGSRVIADGGYSAI